MGDKSVNIEVVFSCRKCEHLLFLPDPTLERLESIANSECPGCGEESENLWILSRLGNYEKEYGKGG